jgi:hypothetical protein
LFLEERFCMRPEQSLETKLDAYKALSGEDGTAVKNRKRTFHDEDDPHQPVPNTQGKPMSSRLPKLMTASLAAILLMAAQAAPVHAGSNLDFSLNNINAITLYTNGDWTLAFLITSGGPMNSDCNPTAGEQAISISDLSGVTESPPITAYLYLNASSPGRASSSMGVISQPNFSGSFAITQNANGSGVNYLSGSFTHWTVSGSGSNATFTASPTATSTLTSSVITDLSPASVLPFVFSNVTPDIHIQLDESGLHNTNVIAAFTAGAAAVPEPSSLVLVGFGALGVVGYGLRRRKASGA